MAVEKRKIIMLVEPAGSGYAPEVAREVSAMGHALRVVHHGEQAVGLAGSPGAVNLAIIAIDLEPGLSAAETAARILQQSSLPLLFLSARGAPEELAQVQALPHFGFILKNAASFTLRSTIETALSLFALHRQMAENELKYRTVADYTYDWEYLIRPDNSLWYCSPSCERITGYTKDAFETDPLLLSKIVHPDDQAAFRAHLALTEAASDQPTGEITFRIFTLAGELRWIDHRCQPAFSPDGCFLGRRISNRDITDKILDHRRLQDSEKALKDAGRIAHLGHFAIDLPTGQTIWSDEAFRILGMQPGEITPSLEAFSAHIHPDDVTAFHTQVNRSIREGQSCQLEYRILTSGGQLRYVRSSANIEPGPDGAPLRMFGALLDITSSKTAEEEVRQLLREKDILLREIHHRIKNNLYTVSTLLGLQADELRDPAAVNALLDARSRIQSMMEIYDRLYRSVDFKQVSLKHYLGAVVSDITTTWNGIICNLEIVQDIDEIIVEPGLAFPLGIIFNEVATNACKYAFPNGRSGRLTLQVKQVGEHSISMTIADNGIGLPPEIDLDRPASFGLNLIMLLAGQLHAQLTVSRDAGTTYRLSVPV